MASPSASSVAILLAVGAIVLGGVALGIGCSARETARYNRQAGVELTAWAQDHLRKWAVHVNDEIAHPASGAHDPPPPPPPW